MEAWKLSALRLADFYELLLWAETCYRPWGLGDISRWQHREDENLDQKANLKKHFAVTVPSNEDMFKDSSRHLFLLKDPCLWETCGPLAF